MSCMAKENHPCLDYQEPFTCTVGIKNIQQNTVEWTMACKLETDEKILKL